MKNEVEIKYLLDGEKGRDRLLDALRGVFPEYEKTKSSRIISYFYKDGSKKDHVIKGASGFLSNQKLSQLKDLLNGADEFVVKARSVDEKVEFTVKCSASGEDAVHAIIRREFEVIVSVDLETVNNSLVSAGVELASKWSSDRDYYQLSEVTALEVEFVSGYGYKAELEVLTSKEENSKTVSEIRKIADKLGLKEPEPMLFREMYNFYNDHWQDYFNTKNVFSDEIWQKLGRA